MLIFCLVLPFCLDFSGEKMLQARYNRNSCYETPTSERVSSPAATCAGQVVFAVN
jgi:hypothetical protein